MECLKHADSALYDIKKGTKHDFKVWQKVQNKLKIKQLGL